MNKAQMLTAMSQHTGLDRNTVKDLLKKGWTYEEQTDTGRKQFFSPDYKKQRNV